MTTRRVWIKDKTVLDTIQALGVTSDWENSPMSLYVDDWPNVSALNKATINTTLAAADYIFDHDEEV